MSPILPGCPSSNESRRAPLLSITRAASAFVVLLLGVAGASVPGQAPASQIPIGFTDSLLADHLDNPVALPFLPDGRLMVAELKTARIRLMAGGQPAGPIAVIDSASPRLKATTSNIPKATRWSVIAPKSTTRADGQGRMPPEIPTPISPRRW